MAVLGAIWEVKRVILSCFWHFFSRIFGSYFTRLTGQREN